MYHYKNCGLDNVWLKNGFKQTNGAYGKGTGIHDIDGLHEALATSVVKKPAPMTGKEFRFLRVEMDLSQKAIGDLMDKTDQMIAKWEKGESDVPVLADAAMRNLYLESIGGSPIAGLLKQLKDLDRNYHEVRIELEETGQGWELDKSA